MLEINYLRGFSGLRLYKEAPIHIKPGINLIVGRNGSGKSNFASLVKSIVGHTQPLFHGRQLLESEFIEQIRNEAHVRYLERCKDLSVVDRKNVPVDQMDFGESLLCKFKLDGEEGAIVVVGVKTINSESLESNMKHEQFSKNILEVQQKDHGHKYSYLDISPRNNLNDDTININTDFRLFSSSTNKDNPIVASIVENFNNFFTKELTNFRTGNSALKNRLNELNNTLLKEYNIFFQSTGKTLDLTLDPAKYGGRSIVIKDGKNIIGFDKLSDGEKNLFNLMVLFATARESKPKLIVFEEPETYMHDDMIAALVGQINKLALDLPQTAILILSHSSALIENMADLGKGRTNLISISNKVIRNSSEDVDFVNVLTSNGVRFSPLYLSRVANVFIENSGEKSQKFADFLSGFFDSEIKPNIIPIGSSGEVKNFFKQKDILENIISTSLSGRNIGLLDGDIYLAPKLTDLDNNLEELVQGLICKGAYIASEDNSKLFYLNFWEIENLYFVDEIIGCWKSKGKSLTKELLLELVKMMKVEILDSWLKTVEKVNHKPIYFRDSDTYNNALSEAVKHFEKFQKNRIAIKSKLSSLFDIFIGKGFTNWFPGKELLNKIQEDYVFDKHGINFDSLTISLNLRAILAVNNHHEV